jgi:Velvet factor
MSGLAHVVPGYGGDYPFPQQEHDPTSNPITIQSAPTYNPVADSPDLAYANTTTTQAAHAYPVRPLSSGLNTGVAGPPPMSPVHADGWHTNGVPTAQDASTNGYRTWASGPSYPALDAQGHSTISSPSVPSTFDPSLSGTLPNQYQSIELQEGQPSWSQSPPSQARVFPNSGASRPGQEIPPHNRAAEAGPPPNHHAASSEQSMYASASIAQQQMREGRVSPSSSSGPLANAPLPGHVYTRTLVGPLSANACRLLDEHRKPGVFFLFQDLSIRTEGTVIPLSSHSPPFFRLPRANLIRRCVCARLALSLFSTKQVVFVLGYGS